MKSTPRQWLNLVDRTIEIVESDTGAGWRPVLIEDASELWSAHDGIGARGSASLPRSYHDDCEHEVDQVSVDRGTGGG